jgi:hypothetical protein
MSMDTWLDRLGGAWSSRMEILCVGSPAWQALGAQACRVNIVQGCAGLGGVAGKAEIMQGWGAWPSKMELLQGCAGLGGCGLVEIVNVCGSLALMACPTDSSAVLRGWSLG